MLIIDRHGSVTMLGTLLFLLAACQQCILADSDTLAPPEAVQYNGTLYAACKMRPSSTLAEGLPKVYGEVLFKQDTSQGKLKILLRFNGLPVEAGTQPRGVHIHQFGDLSQGCDSTGGHYNPYHLTNPKHASIIGNFEPQQGKISAMLESDVTLFGGLSVIGRAVLIHATRDDMGLGGNPASLLNGNAGLRIGCCVIGISSPDLWNTQHKLYTGRLRGN